MTNIAENYDEAEAETTRGKNIAYEVSMFPYEARDILYMVREMTPKQRRDSFEYLVETADYINKAIKECQ